MAKLPSGLDINNLIDDLRIYSWEASDLLIYYSKQIRDPKENSKIIKSKSIEDPVTIADLKVNELIINKINKNYKNIGWDILSEENMKFGSHTFENKSDWCWVLDPLDGTKDFIQGTSNYSMHLALNFRQKPYIGVVLIPEKGELWIADGEKVWCEKKDGSKIKPKLSRNKSLQNMTLVTSKNHRNEILKNLINKIQFNKVKIMGSIGCKIASIVRGESDIYICLSLPGKSSPKDWDFAAPEAILKASGGAITDLDNKELSYGKPKFEKGGIIIASNNISEHKAICSEIKKIIKKYKLYPL